MRKKSQIIFIANWFYRYNDLDLILEIKSLLYERKFTIKGAQQFLKSKNKEHVNNNLSNKIIKLTNNIDLQVIKDIKYGLEDLIALLEEHKV